MCRSCDNPLAAKALCQHCSSALEPLLHRFNSNVRCVGGIGNRAVASIYKFNRIAKRLWESTDALSKFTLRGDGSAKRVLFKFVHAILKHFNDRRVDGMLTPVLSELGKGDAVRNAAKPRSKGAFLVVIIESSPSNHHRFLKDVVDERLIANHRTNEREQRRGVLAHQNVEDLLGARRRTGLLFTVGNHTLIVAYFQDGTL